jgi:membrane protein implicated in regulation of membrane protease activity
MKNANRMPFDAVDAILIAGIVVAAATALLAIFPSAWWALLAALDIRGWSRTTWFLLNLLVVVVLLGIRLVPALRVSFAAHRVEAAKRRRQAERAQKAADRKAQLARRIRRY